MRSFFTKKRSLVALGALAAMVIASAAFAAFTSSGSGSGNASVGAPSATGDWSVAQTGSSGTLYPDPAGTGGAVGNGANIDTVTYDVTNNGHGSLLLASVTAQIATSTGGTWSSQSNTSLPKCTANDFSINGQPVGQSATDTTLAGDVNAGKTTNTSTFKVEMIDNGLNQDNCENLTPPIYYTAN